MSKDELVSALARTLMRLPESASGKDALFLLIEELEVGDEQARKHREGLAALTRTIEANARRK